jgi:selenocysteine-specific elongation factor
MRLPDFSGPPEGSPEAHLIAQAREAMTASGLSGFSANAFADALGSDAKISRALLAMLVRETKAIETGGLWFGHSAVEQLTREVHAHLDAHETLSVQSFKQITGLGRKQSIPLLEYLDRNRVTRRQGDDRIKA